MRLIHMTLWCFVLSTFTCLAQEKVKIEYEKQVKQSEIPHSILLSLKPILNQAKHIKYYIEKDSLNTFYEIKLKFQKKPLSIKFTENGELYDLEETILLKRTPLVLRDSLQKYFSNNYINYKFKKIQKRYTTENISFIEAYLNRKFNEFNITFEIEAFIKLEKDNQSGLYEFLFSEEGTLLEKSKLITREADYVLY